MRLEDFDAYRRLYRGMAASDVREFYERLHRDHPDQNYYDERSAIQFFRKVKARSVFEFGGAGGKLAGTVLSKFPDIEAWHNYEIAEWKPETEDPRYLLRVTDDFVWTMPGELGLYDTLVTSHSLEHITLRQSEQLVDRLVGVRCAYIDYPDKPHEEWEGMDAHVNEMDRLEVERMMYERSFRLLMLGSGHRGATAMGFVR